MEFSKSLIIISLLFVFCISLGAVSAAEDADMSVNDINNVATVESSANLDDEINMLNTGETGNFNSLNDIIKGSSDDIIYLDKDYKFDENVDSKYIEGVEIFRDNLVIDGQGHTIDGSRLARIFAIEGSNITIKGINFINGYSNGYLNDNGGAILFSEGSISIENCTFINNTAKEQGGAIYVGFNAKVFKVHNNIFENNSANKGSAIYSMHNIINSFNFYGFQNNITTFPDNLIYTTSGPYKPPMWIVLNITNSNGKYIVKFVSKLGGNVSMPDYNASLTINNNDINITKQITIKNDGFKDTFVEGDYLLTSLNTGNVLVNTTLGRHPVYEYKILTFDSDYGEIASVIVNVPINVTGNITVKVDNKLFTGKIKEGYAPIPITGLSAGNHNLKIYYSGDENYNPFNDTANLTINKVHINIIPTALSTTYGSGDYFTVKVLNRNKKPVSGVKLTLKIYTGSKVNKTVTITTDKNGIAKYSASKLSIGTHKVVITFSNPNYIVDSNKNSSITISKAKKSSKEEDEGAVSYNNRVSNSVGNMENCGTSLVALLIALISLPILRRK